MNPARQTPREAPGSSVSQSRSWSCAKQTLRASIAICNAVTSNNWKLEAGNWKLGTTGNKQQLETSWKLEAGNKVSL